MNEGSSSMHLHMRIHPFAGMCGMQAHTALTVDGCPEVPAVQGQDGLVPDAPLLHDGEGAVAALSRSLEACLCRDVGGGEQQQRQLQEGGQAEESHG